MQNKINELSKKIAALQSIKADMEAENRANIFKMTKEQKIEASWKLPELTEGHWDLIKECGFMTGSVVYGDPDTANDTDWCVNTHPKYLIGYAIGADNTDYFESDGFQLLYCHWKGQLINVICFSDISLMNAWYQATQYMKILRNETVKSQLWVDSSNKLALVEPFNTKWSRVRMFRALVDVLGPVKELYRELDYNEATQYNRCKRCGREAINFMNAQNRQRYEETLICERCM